LRGGETIACRRDGQTDRRAKGCSVCGAPCVHRDLFTGADSGHIVHAGAIKANGVDAIVCVGANDAFVMDAWGRDKNADELVMVRDGFGEFTCNGLDARAGNPALTTRTVRGDSDEVARLPAVRPTARCTLFLGHLRPGFCHPNNVKPEDG